MRTKLAFLAGIAGALTFTIYCGGVPGAQGEAPDAGAEATDGGTGGKAPRTFTASCDKESVFVDPVNETTARHLYADVEVPGLDPAAPAIVSVTLCDRECTGSGIGGENCRCPAGLACSGTSAATGYTPPQTSCTTGTASIAAGRAVVLCGRSLADGSRTNGYRYSRVVLTVE